MNIFTRAILPLILTAPLLVTTAQAEEKSGGALEGYNRSMHGFNSKLDKWLLKPVTRGYKAVTPDPLEQAVSNFFGNLKEVINIPNDLLQGKFKQAANDTGRLLVNSTLGIGGLFEVADEFGLEKSDGEDLGQTLATWGVPSGPYVVVPLLGPSTLRDFPSMVVDNIAFDVLPGIDRVRARNSLYGLRLLDTRSQLLDAEALVTGDSYTFFKDAYLQRREFLANDGEVEDDFGEEDE